MVFRVTVESVTASSCTCSVVDVTSSSDVRVSCRVSCVVRWSVMILWRATVAGTSLDTSCVSSTVMVLDSTNTATSSAICAAAKANEAKSDSAWR